MKNGIHSYKHSEIPPAKQPSDDRRWEGPGFLLTLGSPDAFNNESVLDSSSGRPSAMRATFCLSNSISISCGIPSFPLFFYLFSPGILKIPFFPPSLNILLLGYL